MGGHRQGAASHDPAGAAGRGWAPRDGIGVGEASREGAPCLPWAGTTPGATPGAPQQIMKDKWINIGYEGDELKPYKEPEEDFGDAKRIGEGAGASLAPRGRAAGGPGGAQR